MKLLIVIFSIVSINAVAASDVSQCVSFSGSYSRQIGKDDTFSSQGLKIDTDLRSSGLILTFNSDLKPSQWNGWIESYIADGLSHQGDANTGLYTVSCTPEKISISREGLLLKPLITEISIAGDQLYYLSYVEVAEPHATHMTLKKIH